MFKIGAFLFLFVFIGYLANAQYEKAVPAEVNIDSLKDYCHIPLYAIAENHFRFTSASEIQGIFAECKDTVANAVNIINIKKVGVGHYVIESPLLQILETQTYTIPRPAEDVIRYIYTPEIELIFCFKNNTRKKIRFQYNLYPLVKIEFLDTTGHLLDISKDVKYCGKLTCHAKWDSPFYISNKFRIRGHFTVILTGPSGMEPVWMEGWHDIGEVTKPLDLTQFKQYKTITASVKNEIYHDTFGGIEHDINLSAYTSRFLELSDYDPPKIRFILDE